MLCTDTGLLTLTLEPTSSATPTNSRRSRRPGRSRAVSSRSGLRHLQSAHYISCSPGIPNCKQLSSHAKVQGRSAGRCTHLLVAPMMNTSRPFCRPSI